MEEKLKEGVSGEENSAPEETTRGTPPGMMNDEGMRRQDLENMFQRVRDRDNESQERKKLNENKFQLFKADILKRVFEEMKNHGVDLNDLKSINEFMQKLAQQDPDLLILFESALGGLLPEEREGIPAEGQEIGVIPPGGVAPEGQREGIDKRTDVVPGNVPVSETGPNLMDKNSNLQENILRK